MISHSPRSICALWEPNLDKERHTSYGFLASQAVETLSSTGKTTSMERITARYAYLFVAEKNLISNCIFFELKNLFLCAETKPTLLTRNLR